MSISLLQTYVRTAIPLVYDESLSYLEFVAAVNGKVNEMITELNSYLSTDIETIVTDILTGWIADGTLAGIVNTVLVGQGNRTYTEQNFIVNNETVTASLDKLDMSLYDRIYQVQVTDTHANLQALLDSGRSLLFPDGLNYTLTDTLTLSVDGTSIILGGGSVVTVPFHDRNVFHITGDRCSIQGTGKIANPDYWAVGMSWTHAIVMVEGDYSTFKDFLIHNVSTIGFGIKDVNHVKIQNVTINGNLPANPSGNTTHMGIVIDPVDTYPGGDIIISGCMISGCVEGVFAGALATGDGVMINITGNNFYDCFDHGVYIGISPLGSVIANNTFISCMSPIAITGENHVVIGNTMLYKAGTPVPVFHSGISGRNCVNCVISGNTIKLPIEANFIGLDIVTLGSGTQIENNVISNNIIDTGTEQVIAIRIANVSAAPVTKNNQIINNVIRSATMDGYGAITFSGGSIGTSSKHNRISGNQIQQVGGASMTHAVYMLYDELSQVSDNLVEIAFNAPAPVNVRPIHLFGCEGVKIDNNQINCLSGFGSNISVIGFFEMGGTTSNLYLDNKLMLSSPLLTASSAFSISSPESRTKQSADAISGLATIASGTNSITISNGNARSAGRLSITPANGEAGKKPFYYTITDGSFDIKIGDGVNTTANAIYSWTLT